MNNCLGHSKFLLGSDNFYSLVTCITACIQPTLSGVSNLDIHTEGISNTTFHIQGG
jgi:hypothetical protein